MKWVRRMYDWMMQWGHSPHGTLALFVIAFIESSFFPIPPDVLLMALCLGLPLRSFRFALVCSLGSVLGGCFGYLIGYGFWNVAGPIFFSYVPGVTGEGFQHVQGLFETHNFWVVFTAGFTPIPFKVITVGAGVVQVPFGMFLVASAVSRSLRFFLIAALLYYFGKPVKAWIEKYFNILTLVFTLLLLGGFALIKLLH